MAFWDDAGKWLETAAKDTGKWVEGAAKDVGKAATDTGKFIGAAADEFDNSLVGQMTIAGLTGGLSLLAYGVHGAATGKDNAITGTIKDFKEDPWEAFKRIPGVIVDGATSPVAAFGAGLEAAGVEWGDDVKMGARAVDEHFKTNPLDALAAIGSGVSLIIPGTQAAGIAGLAAITAKVLPVAIGAGKAKAAGATEEQAMDIGLLVGGSEAAADRLGVNMDGTPKAKPTTHAGAPDHGASAPAQAQSGALPLAVGAGLLALFFI